MPHSRCCQARELKRHVDVIRKDYTRNMQSSDVTVVCAGLLMRHTRLTVPQQAQLAVTTYLVDKLALRAGGEKDEDLADTVGVCTLRVRLLSEGASLPVFLTLFCRSDTSHAFRRRR